MLNKLYILSILWLGIFSSQLVFGATCDKDSVITYNYNGDPTTRLYYYYDASGRLTETVGYKLSDSTWVGYLRNTTSYTESGQITESASWIWRNNSWEGNKQSAYEYDSNNRILSESTYSGWANNDWVGTSRKEYVYDARGNRTTIATFTWVSNTNGWSPQNKYEYTFDSQNRQVEIKYFVGKDGAWQPKTWQEYAYDGRGNVSLNRYWNDYDATTNKWIGESWQNNTYNENNKPIVREQYKWENGGWVGVTKIEQNYNNKGQQILYLVNTWDKATSAFVGSTKTIYDYDQWTNLILGEQYQWKNNSWVGDIKFRYEYTAYQSDPIMTTSFQWDSISASFIGVDSIRTASDEAKNQILDERYTYNVPNHRWDGTLKEEYIYDDAKNIISKKTYQWLSTQWINATKDSSAYDANRNKVLEEHYTWDTTDNYWVGNGEKHVSEWTNNNETLQEVYIWSTELKDWTYKSKIIKEYDGTNVILDEEYQLFGSELRGTKKEKYAYNAKGDPVMTVKYAWLYDEVWQGTDSVLANYDNNKQQTLNEKYTWATPGDYWKGSEKATYTFNKNKQQTSSWVYSWDDTNRQWIYASRDTSSYDSKKNLTLDERYTYDVTNQSWVGTLKKEYAYNTKGQQTMFAYYAWDETTSKFIGTQKEENEMDDAGRTTLHASYTWNDTDWKGKSKDTYTYFRNDTVADHITFTWKSSKWVESKKTTDSYSDAGQHTATANFTWNTTSQSWLGVKQTTWEYTTTGKVATEIVSTWGTTDWVNSTKLENTYTEEVLTAYINSKWESDDWVYVSKWEQTDPNTDCTYEWWNSAWSKTQENKKEYDSENRLILESKQNWQQGVPTAGSKTEYTYTGSNLTQKSNYTYDSGWMETYRETNAFDEANRQTLAMTQTFENGQQTSGDKTTHTYNGEGMQTNITISTWAGTDWQYVSKVDNEYVGKSVTTTSYIWDSSIPNWQGVEKDEKIYSNDLDYTSTKSEWRNGGWFGISKTGYTYYVDGREHTIVDYLWSSSTWVEDFMTEYAYSGANNKVTATYTYQEGKWVGQTKEGVYYDEYEDLTTATWTWNNGAWSPQAKLGQSLDGDGRTISKTSYKISGSDFVFTTRVEYEYGNTAKDITTANYTWDGAAWKGVSKSGEVWDGSKITSKITYTWTGGFTWQYNQKTEYEYGSHQSDLTTAIYSWDYTIPDWVGVSKSGKTYASTGKQASEFSYVWGTTAAGKADWLPVTKTEWEYGSGKDNAKATYKGVDTAWVGISKYAEQYTEHGDSLGFYTYCWKNGAWADSLKQEHHYDNYGNDTLYINAQWKNNDWVNTTKSTKWEIKYDENDSIIVDAHYTWNKKKGWVGKGKKYEYSYNLLGALSSTYIYSWNNNSGWNKDSEYKWEYNNKGLLTLYTLRNYVGNTGQMSEYAYNVNDVQSMEAQYTWNSSKGWQGIYKSETLYDNEGVYIGDVSYTWNYTTWKWNGGVKKEYIYDEQGRVISQIQSTYDAEKEEWQFKNKTTNVYDMYNRLVEKRSEIWSEGLWLLESESITSYDVDPYTRLRYMLTTSLVEGIINTYQMETYYYACDPKFTITVNTQEEGTGEVSGGGIYTYYARPQIAAVVDSGCTTFHQWTDGETATKRRILVTADMTYTASFAPITRTIRASVAPSGGGSVRVALKPDE